MDTVAAHQLTEMPLHAITEALGEEGLRARFALEIGRFEPRDRQRLTAALGLATDLHRNDRRVLEPYMNHLLRVAIRMTSHYEVLDADVIIAGILHDAAEDHAPELAGRPSCDAQQAQASAQPGTQAGTQQGTQAGAQASAQPDEAMVRAAISSLGQQFGQRVASLVAAVTNPLYDQDRDIGEQYRDHIATSLDRNPWARVIKVSDFTDNGVGVIHTTDQKARRAATKYRPLVPVLRELVGRPDTPLSDWVKRHIFDQLDLAEERFNDILSDTGGPSWSNEARS